MMSTASMTADSIQTRYSVYLLAPVPVIALQYHRAAFQINANTLVCIDFWLMDKMGDLIQLLLVSLNFVLSCNLKIPSQALP